jgi:hypothetical protein
MGLMDSVMQLYGQRYWRHCVKLMLSVSCQSISSEAREGAYARRSREEW